MTEEVAVTTEPAGRRVLSLQTRTVTNATVSQTRDRPGRAERSPRQDIAQMPLPLPPAPVRSMAYLAGRDLLADRDRLAVQALLGYSKPETTQRFVAIPNDALRRPVTSAGDAARSPIRLSCR